MGIEYRHYIVVNDATWLPEPDTASRIEKVLREWSLVDKLKQVIDLSNGQHTIVDGTQPAVNPGPGLALLFAGIIGLPVERIAGPSLYVSTAERYTMGISLVVGNDYRIHWSSDGIWFELTSPPHNGGKPIEPYPDEEPLKILYGTSFPSEGSTSPPKVEIHVADHSQKNVGWKDYLGFWRCAVVIDFGKDLPSFIEGVHVLPNNQFIRALANAIRGDIVEVGELH